MADHPHNADAVPSEKKLDDLYALIRDLEIALLTTRRADGHLVSRPMATQERRPGCDLWFVTNKDTDKLDEIAHDPHVNCAFYDADSREWVSVAGTAHAVDDREKIRALYSADWKAWFPDEGGNRDGGPDDPRLRLIFVDAHSVTYLKQDKPRPVVLFEVAKAAVTGGTPDAGSLREVSPGELRRDTSAPEELS
jgi:general stress protein 26